MSDSSGGLEVNLNLHGKAATIVSIVFYSLFGLFVAIFVLTICCLCGCRCPKWPTRNRRTTYTATAASRPTTTATRTSTASTTTTNTATTTTATNAAESSSATTTSNGGAAASLSDKLDAKVLASKPSFVYTSAAHEKNLECRVCFLKFKDGEKGRRLVNCGHSFHEECINKWLKSHSTCPTCKSTAEYKIQELPV